MLKSRYSVFGESGYLGNVVGLVCFGNWFGNWFSSELFCFFCLGGFVVLVV